MAQSRLERLDPIGRQVLRAASIFGQSFCLEGVAALMGRQGSPALVEDWFKVLAERELITARRGSTSGGGEFGFRHDLVREAAYAMLTDEDREKGHKLAAEWLVESGEKDPLLLAEHYEAGGDPLASVPWYLRAASLALEGNDIEGTLARVRSAMACGAQGSERTSLKLIELKAHAAHADNDAILATAPAVLQELPQFDDSWCVAVTSLAVARARTGDTEFLINAGRDLLGLLDGEDPIPGALMAAARLAVSLMHVDPQLAASIGDRLVELIDAFADSPHVIATIELLAAQRAFFASDLGQCILRFERGIDSYKLAGDDRLVALHLGNLAEVHMAIGDFESARLSAEQALALCDRIGSAGVSWGAHLNRGRALAGLGDPQAGAKEARLAAEGFDGQGNIRMRGTARALLALMLDEAGDPIRAAKVARQAVEDLTSVSSLLPLALTVQAALSLRRGDRESAEEPLRLAWSALQDHGGLEQGEALLRLTRAQWLHARGELEAAKESIREARAAIEKKADCIADATARDRFLSRVPEHSQIQALAESW
jgi:tetratricopeptide (TPR) repeat protein